MPSFGRRRAAALAVAVAVLAALALRVVALGDRTFHWDEARVGYWVLQYAASGEWSYRAIVHGPFLFHVNEWLFGVFGASDAVARAPVAVVGALLPATAWLFRARLDDVEVAALAGLLALNPVLVYYSRFMRSDVLVAAFSVAALGLAVRALDTRRGGYLVAAGAVLGLAFTTKENALVYVAMFAGASALLLDEQLFTARTRGESFESVLHATLQRVGGGLVAWRRALAGGTLAFLVVVVVFYAPRPEFYAALANPTQLPGVVAAGTAGAWAEFWNTWGISGSASRQHSYIAFLADALRTLGAASLMLVAAAVVGFLAERYATDDSRDLVLFAGYWAVASVVVYPAITDISGHWSVVHAVVPLAIPAAVGVRVVVDRGRSAYASDDRVGVALAALVLVAAVGQMGAVTAETSYLMPQDEDNALVQYGQPGSDMGETLDRIERIAPRNDGTDVLYYGSHFYITGDYDPTDPDSVAGTDWFNRLPLPWYTERADATTDSTVRLTEPTTGNATGSVETADAPVVVTEAENYRGVREHLHSNYEGWTYELTATNTIIVVFVDTEAPGFAEPR
ncbi:MULTISPECIES: flippase activity-associated protein Agl23 [Halobacterium]|uniref:flippase activity-associated protein Agl23 n=1 Tax=Halobacterium TaxID=2239 RepID=UPI0009E7F650|nr:MULTISPECIES: flippase activity-associated protein Agl23 [Halobacterium]MCG1002437.1 TIGR03663 family protein [Halobacterium noricense]